MYYRSILHSIRYWSFVFTVLLLTCCQKDPRQHGDDSGEVFTVNFNVQDPAWANSLPNSAAAVLLTKIQKLNADVQYLYFWSFNNETLQADIAVQPGAQITYNDGLVPSGFAAGWPYGDYIGGRALSIVGAKDIVFELPVQVVATFEMLGFDVSSSATGPKAFNLYYSFDNEDWRVLQMGNQFSNFLTSQARNTFTYDLSDMVLDGHEHIRLRLEMAAGERGSGSAYNENTGALRLDNFRLRGVLRNAEPSEGEQLRIYAFDQENGNLVSSVVQDYSAGMLVASMDLPHGTYQFSFVRNNTHSNLILPPLVSSASTYFMSNRFSAYKGEVFGAERSIFINQNMQESVRLDRYFSQIKFQFTDAQDLSIVDRVVVVRKGEPFFYAPFNLQMMNPVLDQSEIELHPSFGLSKELHFNQFIGRVDNPVNLDYQLLIYAASGELLRTLDVAALARNNVQIVFRGELLGSLPFDTGFQIDINEEWDDQVEVQF